MWRSFFCRSNRPWWAPKQPETVSNRLPRGPCPLHWRESGVHRCSVGRMVPVGHSPNNCSVTFLLFQFSLESTRDSVDPSGHFGSRSTARSKEPPLEAFQLGPGSDWRLIMASQQHPNVGKLPPKVPPAALRKAPPPAALALMRLHQSARGQRLRRKLLMALLRIPLCLRCLKRVQRALFLQISGHRHHRHGLVSTQLHLPLQHHRQHL